MDRKLNKEGSPARAGRLLFRKLLACLDDLIYPPSIECIVCKAAIDDSRTYSLCDRCIRKFAWNLGKTCKLCGKAMREGSREKLCRDCMEFGREFDKALSCVTYGLMERKLVQDFKFKGKTYLGRIISEIMADKLRSEEVNPDLIVPVPVHKRRLRIRGYNQAGLLAEMISKEVNIPVDNEILFRGKDTPARKGLNREERRATIRDAFYVPAGKKFMLEACKILLVDDIMTTGSTADACAGRLKQAGADQVIVLTFASGFDKAGR